MNINQEILKKDILTPEDIILCAEAVKENGDVIVIKLDGERRERQYTAFISFPANKKKEIIRVDESSLSSAILKLLKLYFNLI